MRLRKLFPPFCLILGICSCSSHEPSGTIESYSFLDYYLDIENVSLLFDFEDCKNSSRNLMGSMIGLRLEGSYLSVSERDHLREQLGDNDRHYIKVLPVGATCNPFEKISVCSESVFNDIPAGKPLDDIIDIYAASAYPVLKNKNEGYSSQELDGLTKKQYPIMGMNHDFYWYHKKLSELQPEDIYLLDFLIWLRFTEIPTAKEQTLIVTFKDENGKIITSKVKVCFPE